MGNICLNCDRLLSENYCQNCGQISSTHRYSLKHFIEHDVIHGIWHIDKGILFTIKELFTRPGHSVREYLQGKRINLFPFISLLLILLAISSFLTHYTHIKIADLMPDAGTSKATMSYLEKFSTEYPRLMLVITIPINSLFSIIWFQKAKLNFTEHLVINSYKTAAEMIVGLLFTFTTIYYTNIKNLTFIYYFFVVIFTYAYTIWFFYQLFSKFEYTKKSLIFRSFMILVSYTMIGVVIAFVSKH